MQLWFIDIIDISIKGQGIDGEMGRWGDGEMGRWGDGEMGRWGDGEMGRWGDLHNYLMNIL
ncbi:hypothetical protein [Okeania sp. KiyG1]|uniref:hypothetical protein n=1 Tax=Okeania sp. KiyG1 TaxID=2720165 RepID=UPI001923E1A7|nr:hypothetical protein [Okeania sp. KiyG1]GGA40028.1 hypothetical protein CYANOKiyG1_58210 [Okeania sp. KiyG1]